MSAPLDIYVRVSRIGSRGERLISPGEQERRARELARAHGLEIGEVLTDLDESGGKLDRPALRRALARVEARESGGLIVGWLDRLSRDSEHAHGLIRRIQDAGGRIFAPDAPSDWTSPEGELQAGIVFAFAQYIRSRARAGFERAKERSIANGVPVHGHPPVGYRRGPDRRLEPDPVAGPVVRELFERRARGEGPTALGRLLEQHGIRTARGSATWSKVAILSVLRNRSYLGEIAYGADRRYVNLTAHEPLVDLATWTAAQYPHGRPLARLRSAESPYLLTGLIRCSACGYACQPTRTGRGKRAYRCARRHAGGRCPEPTSLLAETAEKAAVEAFWQLTGDLEAEGSTGEDTAELQRLEQALADAERALAGWSSADVQAALGDDISTYAAGLAERRAVRDRAAAALGRARADAAASPGPLAQPVATLRESWEEMTVAERRELLHLRFDCIGLARGRKLTFYAKGSGPADLPRRGRPEPRLVPLPPAEAA